MKLRFDPKLPIIVVSPTLVGIAGIKKKIDMALDSGATYTMIPWDMAEVLGYKLELSRIFKTRRKDEKSYDLV